MDETVQSILDENDLVIKQIPEGPFNLMRAISNCLYFSSINYKQIQEQCIRFLKQMIDQKKLPEKLNQFKNSITLYNDFISDPNNFDYHKIIDQSLDVNKKQSEKFVNYEYEHWFQERISQLNEYSQDAQANCLNQSNGNLLNQPRFKRSLSDKCNNNHNSQQNKSQETLELQIIEQNERNSILKDTNIIQKDENTLKLGNKSSSKRASQFQTENDTYDAHKLENLTNIQKQKRESFLTPKIDISLSAQQAFDKRSMISPIHFVKSTPPGISPKPNMNANNQKFNWKDEEDSDEDSIIEEKPNENEQIAYSNQNSGTLGPPSKRNSSKFSSGSLTSASPSKQKGDKDAPLSQFAQKQPKVVDMSEGKVRGSLKFFEEKKNYGFFVLDEDGSDIFVHFDDLEKAGVTKDMLKESLEKKIKLNFIFNCMIYVGKYKQSKKAVDIEQIFDDEQNTSPNQQSSQKQQNQEDGVKNSNDNHNTNKINKQSSSENQQQSSEQKKKQISDRFAGFSSIIEASQNCKNQTISEQQQKIKSDNN